MNVLILYDQYSTFTNTVFDHLRAFSLYSGHRHAYCHGQNANPKVAWDNIDAVVIHYCLRVAFNQIPEELQKRLAAFTGPKILFVQDEYDLTENTRRTVERLDIGVVFTCVPQAHRELIYPRARFPEVRFVTTLTGYLPMDALAAHEVPPIRDRCTLIAYRGRALPYFYGDLGQEKLIIAQRVREACVQRRLPHDIEWSEDKRIYGPPWLAFLMSAKATLGTESGCNLFDEDGSLRQRVAAFLAQNPAATYAQAKQALFGGKSEVPIMNQISPRFFEAISFKTALILFEGEYSGILRPWRNFIPLRKDFSNLDEVFAHVQDDEALQAMVDRTYDDVIASGKYTYASFIREYDAALDAYSQGIPARPSNGHWGSDVTDAPVRSNPVPAPPAWMSRVWNAIPSPIRQRMHHRVVKLWLTLRKP
jgi:hypothetical protein